MILLMKTSSYPVYGIVCLILAAFILRLRYGLHPVIYDRFVSEKAEIKNKFIDGKSSKYSLKSF